LNCELLTTLAQALTGRYTQNKENVMPQAQMMTLHEKLTLGVEAIELKKQGKLEEAMRIEKSIPLPPYLAKWAKKRLGADFLIKQGWNLSEAEAEYGPDWLTR
jgi:hypothetical protein